MRKSKYIFFLLFIFIQLGFSQADTIRVATYNFLNFPGNDSGERIPYFRTVLRNMNPDILVTQEIQSQVGVNAIASQALNNRYSTVPFHDGEDTDNSIFFRTGAFTFVKSNYIRTDLRDIAEYVLTDNLSGEELHVFSAHLKASQGSDNEQKRLAEVRILINHLENLPAGTNAIVVGDFNIYSGSEPAFTELIGTETLLDPIHDSGYWHNNGTYSYLHTQSPRIDQFGGGSTGGLDDRFDMILISNSLADNFLPGSYTAYGNDAHHFNESINQGANSAVADSIADALYYASDHLPVYCEFVFGTPASLSHDKNQAVHSMALFQNYPNPFNPATRIDFQIGQRQFVSLKVFDLLGHEVSVLVHAELAPGNYHVTFDGENLPGGIYFCRLQCPDQTMIKKMVLLR
ncbi:MAG: T9SS type A sorting domain-containing protein [Calditrichia bacterium]